jgi:hypothetical protein
VIGEEAVQVNMLRELVGPVLFRSITINPEWIKWQNGKLSTTAQSIDKENRYSDMPILADALEEAGCTDSDMLNHCRKEHRHIKGCWVLDMLLGRNGKE